MSEKKPVSKPSQLKIIIEQKTKDKLAELEEQKKVIEREAMGEAIVSFCSPNMQLRAFMQEMQANGLWEQALAMTFEQILGQTNGGKPKRTRMSAERKATILADIPKLLKIESWSSKKMIAEAVGEDPNKISKILNELVDAKKIKRHGERRNTVYTVVGDKAKPA